MKNSNYKLVKAEIFNQSWWVDFWDPEQCKITFEKILEKSEFQILQFNEHYFDEQGYTCFWLLAESHLAIHTFPESRTSYIELSSCNKEKLEVFKLEMEGH